MSLLSVSPSSCTLLSSFAVSHSESSAVSLLPPLHHYGLTHRVGGQIPGALQLSLYVGIDPSKGSQGGRKELMNNSKVLCIISSSGNYHEMPSYGFGDLTLAGPSTDLAAKLCPILFLPEQLISTVFLKVFCDRKKMV